ncbi:MAG: acylphosphatase [Candidatus Diapherotrites archaeon]
MPKRLHVLVSGRVQGVFFRAHTKEWAESLSLKGWVKNLPDGRVEAVAEGEEKALLEFIELLKQGPPSASVEKVEVKWEKCRKEFSCFEVRH